MDDKKQAILDAALALADEKGLDAVSMRAVAERAGLTAMALYPHVGSKAALLDEMVGRLLSGMLPPGAAGQDWKQRLRTLAFAARKLIHDHPWAAALLFSRPAVSPDAAGTVDEIYTGLLQAGVPASEVPRLERMLSTVILGFAASEVGGRFGAGNHDAGQGARPRPEDLPGHHKLGNWLGCPVDWDAEFETDLDDLVHLIEAAARRSAG